MLSADEWEWLCVEIKKDYSNLLQSELTDIISKGIKGFFNEKQFAINAFTIYKWIKSWETDIFFKQNTIKKYVENQKLNVNSQRIK